MNWAYIDEQVAFGNSYASAAEEAAQQAGIDATTVERIGNLVTIHRLPDDHRAAVGTIRDGRPQIWQSNVDRLWVTTSVLEAMRRNDGFTPGSV